MYRWSFFLGNSALNGWATSIEISYSFQSNIVSLLKDKAHALATAFATPNSNRDRRFRAQAWCIRLVALTASIRYDAGLPSYVYVVCCRSDSGLEIRHVKSNIEYNTCMDTLWWQPPTRKLGGYTIGNICLVHSAGADEMKRACDRFSKQRRRESLLRKSTLRKESVISAS